MKNVKSTFVLFVLLTLSVVSVSKGQNPKIKLPDSDWIPSIVSQPETEFPQLSAEVNYADAVKRMEWMAGAVHNGTSFHNLFDSPALVGVNNVPAFENSLYLYFRQSEEKQFYLGSANVQKRSLNRHPAVTISYHSNGIVGYYDEFIHGRYITMGTQIAGKVGR